MLHYGAKILSDETFDEFLKLVHPAEARAAG
jgi:hypothetical protein